MNRRGLLLLALASPALAEEAVPDDEHDAHAWWPPDVERWPDEADETVRRMAALLA